MVAKSTIGIRTPDKPERADAQIASFFVPVIFIVSTEKSSMGLCGAETIIRGSGGLLTQVAVVRTPHSSHHFSHRTESGGLKNLTPEDITMSPIPNTLVFNEQELTVVDHKNQAWLRQSQIGSALGYKHKNAITKIYSRNKEEFTEDMTQTVKLSVSGNQHQEVRIFSPRGCHLLAMFARTENAKLFRAWVLDVLEKQTADNTVEQPTIEKISTAKPALENQSKQNTLYWITIQEEGQAPETKALDLATLIQLSKTQPDFCLIPRRHLGDLVESIAKAESQVMSLLQFADTKTS